MSPAESLREKLIYFLEYAPHLKDRTPEERRAECARMVDEYAHDLAEKQRMWALDYVGDGDDSSYDYTYAVTLGAKLAADLIDPGAAPERPVSSEEKTA